ncbi:MAG: superoxide dismutase [Bacteriovoracia bacterium]
MPQTTHEKGEFREKTNQTEITLPDLPYEKNALEPLMCSETLEYHHDKHHKGYVDKLNLLIEDTEYEGLGLEEIIKRSRGAIFNNAAQVWNHNFFWKSLSPNKTSPIGEIYNAINRDFQSLDNFRDIFKKKATDLFGSGWIWLVQEASGKLGIETTSNAENPLTIGRKAIITCDLWEHAYYIDYRNQRAKYIDAFFKLMNWNFAAINFNIH